MARVLDNIEWLELGKVLSSNKKEQYEEEQSRWDIHFPFINFSFANITSIKVDFWDTLMMIFVINV